MNPDSPQSTVPAGRSYASSILAALALVAALSGCGKGKSPGGTKADAALTLSNKLEAIAVAGYPITLDELNKWYPEPPANQNAAEIYAQAFDALTKVASSDEAKTPAFLARNQKALGLLLQAAGRKSCRYPVDFRKGDAVLLPHLSKIRTCTWLLYSEAISQASHGRTDASTKALLAGVSLARSLHNEPILISSELENGFLSAPCLGLEQALSRKAFTEGQLLSLQTALRDAESSASFRRALAGERALVISHFQMSPEEWAEAWSHAGTNRSQEPDMVAYRKTAVFQEDFTFALDYFSDLLAVAEMPFPQCLDAEQQGAIPKIETALTRHLLLSAMRLPALGGLPTQAGRAAARLRITQAALAVERYRLRHTNGLPGALAELTPDLLDAVPADPFDGQPLRYKKLPGKGYVIYSVGADRKDDNGVSKSADGKPLDITFTVER